MILCRDRWRFTLNYFLLLIIMLFFAKWALYLKLLLSFMFFMMRGGAEVARQAHNLKAVGSIPAPATITISASLRTGFLIS